MKFRNSNTLLFKQSICCFCDTCTGIRSRVHAVCESLEFYIEHKSLRDYYFKICFECLEFHHFESFKVPTMTWVDQYGISVSEMTTSRFFPH